MSDNITNSNLVNLKEKIEKLIQTSPYDEVKSFFNSTTGKFLIDVLEISNSSMNYTNDLLKDEVFFQTMTEYDSVVKKASDLGYHIKRMTPAKIKYSVEINDPENRLNGVSKIVFKGREFSIDQNGINLVQENSYTYNLNGVNYDFYNYLVEGSLITDTFSITNYNSFYKHYLLDSAISNYIDSNNDLDFKLYSKYYGDNNKQTDLDNGTDLGLDGEAWKYVNVFRNGITESDIDLNEGNYAFSSTNSDKELELLFGNGTFGNIGYGDYVVEYFKTSGQSANQQIKSGDTLEVPTNGIEVYDLNGNILNSSIVSGLIQLVSTTDLENGSNYETMDEIKFNAVKLSSLNNTLITPDDFNYYVNYNYNVVTNFWGDNKEAENRFGELKDLNNMVFFTSNDLVYDFEENTNNIKYNILQNLVYSEVGYNQNKQGVFNVVKNCSDENIKDGDCISLSSLYLMGMFKPLMYYYNKGIIYGDNSSSVVSKIINDVDNLGGINNASYVYLNGDVLNFNLNVFYSGNVTIDNTTLTDEIKTEYDSTKNLVQSVSTILSKYNLEYNGINKNYLSVNTIENKSMYEYLTLYTKLRTFEVEMVMSIVNRIDTNFHNSLITPIKMSQFLRDGTRFMKQFMSFCPANKIVIVGVMSYYINKYNALKSLIINQGNYNLFDIEFLSEELKTVTLTKVV